MPDLDLARPSATWASGKGHAFVICFGGNHEGLAWEKRLIGLGHPFLHVQDTRFRWYLDGADGTTGLRDTIDRMEHFRARYPTLPLVTVGQSSGGYAALRFGMMLGADLMLAFAPQTCFLVPRPIHAGQASLAPPPDLVDIRPDLNRSRQSVVIVVGRSEIDNPPQQFSLDDEAHLEGIVERDGLKIIRTEHTSHAVAHGLASSGDLDPFLLDQISTVARRRYSVAYLRGLIAKTLGGGTGRAALDW